jgi:hypothetical protein
MDLYSHEPVDLTIPTNCPWHEAQLSYGTPNVDWCEPTICSYITEPANTWSNIGFLIVALLILKKFKHKLIRCFSWIVLTMGLFSSIYHATNNYMSQYLDFIGMSLMTSFLLTFGIIRVTQKSWGEFFSFYWFFVSMNLVLIMFLDIAKLPVQLLLMMNAVPIVAIEVAIVLKTKKIKRELYFALSVCVLILAQIFAQVDLHRIYCEPKNWILHGHVAWHLLCAVAMYYAAKHLDVILEDGK